MDLEVCSTRAVTMLGLGDRMLGHRNTWLLFSVCLLCLPTVHVANVFPDDLFSRLHKYQQDPYSYKQRADANSNSPTSFSQPSQVPSLQGREPTHAQTALVPLPYPETPPKPLHGNERIFRQLYNGDSSKSAVPTTVVLDTEEAVDSPQYYAIPAQEEVIPTGLREAHAWTSSSRPHGSGLVLASSDPSSMLSKTDYDEKIPLHYYDYYYEDAIDQDMQESVAEVLTQEKTLNPREITNHEQNRHPQSYEKPYSHHLNPSSHAQTQPRPSQQTSCRYCQLREEARNYRIESLKRKILRRLHMSILPNRTGWHVPKALAHMAGIGVDLLQGHTHGVKLYAEGDEDDDDYPPHPNRVIITAKALPETPVPETLHSREENVTYFPMPAEVLRSRVTKANLWFYVSHTSADLSDVVHMRVDHLTPSVSKRRPHFSRVCVWKQTALPGKNDSGWHRVDLTQVVRRWVKNSTSNNGLNIVALNRQRNVAVLHPTSAAQKGYEPTLDITTTKRDTHRRHRRSNSLICTEKSAENRCCRYPLWLTFMDYGWDWVIAPRRMEVGYCSGECRMTMQYNTFHSWLLALAQGTHVNLGLGTSSCCVASKMMATQLLYFNHEGVIVRQQLRDMIVERCGCA